ncbi:MAG: DUF3990 domain-containing protein [Clostridium sp.]|nr:DUF3990 domain-containing protein [Clostridium sp.]
MVIYHGSKDIIEKPYYHDGRSKNDYGFGFYCTESLELAKEWSCSNNENNGFTNKYSINLSGLKILDLTDKRYSILNWIAILLKFRTFDLSNDISIQAKEYLLKNFYIDVNNYDIVIGFRADDSYFSFARDFVNNTIPVRKLSQAMELGQPGKQVVIVSELAFSKLHFEGFETADRLEYFIKRKARDEKAREDYLKGTRKSATLTNDIFVVDIIRKGLKDGNPII